MSQHKRDLYMFIAACLTIILVVLIGAVTEGMTDGRPDVRDTAHQD
jgi:hypothetical protein